MGTTHSITFPPPHRLTFHLKMFRTVILTVTVAILFCQGRNIVREKREFMLRNTGAPAELSSEEPASASWDASWAWAIFQFEGGSAEPASVSSPVYDDDYWIFGTSTPAYMFDFDSEWDFGKTFGNIAEEIAFDMSSVINGFMSWFD